MINENMTDEIAEIVALSEFTAEMRKKLIEMYEDLSAEEHDAWLLNWLKSKVEEKNWVAVGNLSMMLWAREQARKK